MILHTAVLILILRVLNIEASCDVQVKFIYRPEDKVTEIDIQDFCSQCVQTSQNTKMPEPNPTAPVNFEFESGSLIMPSIDTVRLCNLAAHSKSHMAYKHPTNVEASYGETSEEPTTGTETPTMQSLPIKNAIEDVNLDYSDVATTDFETTTTEATETTGSTTQVYIVRNNHQYNTTTESDQDHTQNITDTYSVENVDDFTTDATLGETENTVLYNEQDITNTTDVIDSINKEGDNEKKNDEEDKDENKDQNTTVSRVKGSKKKKVKTSNQKSTVIESCDTFCVLVTIAKVNVIIVTLILLILIIFLIYKMRRSRSLNVCWPTKRSYVLQPTVYNRNSMSKGYYSTLTSDEA